MAFNSFNQSQLEAVNHASGPALVVAGPGSGKTRVLTHRILNLIENHNISPEQILVITFTKAAAIEMKNRFQSLCESAYYPVTFGTFHAIFYQILRSSSQVGISIITEYEKYKILDRVLKQIGIKQSESVFLSELIKEISSYKISKHKEEFQSMCVDNKLFVKIYSQYVQFTKEDNRIDFDDMIMDCKNILLRNNEILGFWQNKFKYILIDEFQDISPNQYETIKLLSEKYRNIFAVGDDDQSIYSFRGAGPDNMFRFLNDFPETKKYQLSINYRCDIEIVSLASKLIGNNKNRFLKDINAYSQQKGETIVYKAKSASLKYKSLCDKINSIIQSNSDYSNMAILLRTNVISPILLNELKKQKIPVVYKEKRKKLSDHFITKDFCAYLKLAVGDLSRENLYTIMNKPNRYISRTIINKDYFQFGELKRKAVGKAYLIENITELERNIKKISQMNPFQALTYIRKFIHYEEYLKEYAYKMEMKYSICQEIIDYIMDIARECKTIQEFLEVVAESDFNEQDTMAVEQGVNIQTMHSSKGLEWDYVFIPDFDEGMIPHKRSRSLEMIEEERRLLYVAITRARKGLYLYTFQHKNDSLGTESPFIKELTGIKEVNIF